VSYIHRTQQVLFGMDTMMNILLFYLMIGNSGAALSLDRLIARYRAVRASLRRSGTIDANTRAFLACPPPSMSAGLALRLIQVHFCFIYVAAGLSKLKGETWWNGRAFWDVVVNPEFTLMQYPWYENSLRWLISVKFVYHFITSTAVWLTLFVEIAGPFLLWTRLRWLMIFFATAMHAAIGVLMGLNLFELLMVVMLLSGLVLWKSVQFPLLRELLGGYETARYIHFFAMLALVGFTAVHLAMAMLVPRTLLTMIRGH
jgi:hypothetical protein